MHRILTQKVSPGALGVSSFTALAFERELTPLWGIGDNLLLGAPASLTRRRGEALNYKFSRQFSLSHVEENFLLKNGLEIGNKRDLPSPPAVGLASSEGEQLLVDAFREGSAKGFVHVFGSYTALSEPGLYELASISTVLNALQPTSGKKFNSDLIMFIVFS